MTLYMINGREVAAEEADDFEVVRQYIDGHGGRNYCADNDLSHEEIMDFFDSNHDGRLSLDDIDARLFQLGGFADVERVLSKYGIRFGPDLGRLLDPKKAILDLVERSDYIFVGEYHPINDEDFFSTIIADLYKAGVRSLAIELASDRQTSIDHLFDKSPSSSALRKSYQGLFPGVLQLIRKAKENGMRIVCIDQPPSKRRVPSAREQYMANKLKPLSKYGKTLVWVGASHVVTGNEGTMTVQELMKESGSATSRIRLECRNVINYLKRTMDIEKLTETFRDTFGIEDLAQFIAGFDVFFGQDEPEKPVACLASAMGSLRYVNADISNSPRFVPLEYSKSLDLIVFLPPSLSKINPAAQKELQK